MVLKVKLYKNKKLLLKKCVYFSVDGGNGLRGEKKWRVAESHVFSHSLTGNESPGGVFPAHLSAGAVT